MNLFNSQTRNPNPLSIPRPIVAHNIAFNVWVGRVVNLIKEKIAVSSIFNLSKEVPLLVDLSYLSSTNHQNRANNKGGNHDAFNISFHNPSVAKWAKIASVDVSRKWIRK